MKGGFFMIDVAWNIFSQTGNVESYLLFKDLEKDKVEGTNNMREGELAEFQNTIQ
jgi:hypothetical protein